MVFLISAFVMAWTVTTSPAPEPAPAPAPNEAQDHPTTIFLGVDCTEPFTVSLPDDVLTECEGELMGR